MKKLAQGFNTAAQDSYPGSLSREPLRSKELQDFRVAGLHTDIPQLLGGKVNEWMKV